MCVSCASNVCLMCVCVIFVCRSILQRLGGYSRDLYVSVIQRVAKKIQKLRCVTVCWEFEPIVCGSDLCVVVCCRVSEATLEVFMCVWCVCVSDLRVSHLCVCSIWVSYLCVCSICVCHICVCVIFVCQRLGGQSQDLHVRVMCACVRFVCVSHLCMCQICVS